jgi:ubiquinone/menaquinone biosynthesis C-methylase UbiE
MDYDKSNIAAVYDSGRGYDSEILQEWLDLFSAYVPKDGVSRIVDLGCGTGRYSEPLSVHFEADVIGLDPSGKMLEEARRKTCRRGVVFEQASGEKLPVDDNSADMVLMSMVFHHLRDLRSTLRECYRVLREQGCVCLRNTTVDAIETFPYLIFFPTVRSVIEEQLPTRDHVTSSYAEAGFHMVAHRIVAHHNSSDWASYAEIISGRSDSFLARISDEEFDAGVAALRDFARNTNPGRPVVQDVDFFVFRR